MYEFEGISVFSQQQLINPLATVGYSLLDFVIGLILAGLIVVVGWAVSWAVHWVIRRLLDKAKVDKFLKKHGLDRSIGVSSFSRLGASLVRWYIFLIFLIPAISYLTLGELTELLLSIARWLPHVVVGIAIMMFGLMLADFVYVRLSKAKGPAIRHLNNVVRIFILVFVTVLALQEVGIYLQLAETTFVILLTGLTLALSLAVGIGFGLGLKDEARSMIKSWKKYL